MKKITRVLLSLTLAALFCAGTILTAFAAEAAPSVSIPVEIILSGTLPEDAEDFTVRLEALDAANPMPEGSVDGVYTMTVTGAGTASFPPITFTRVGIYEYRIYQVKGSNTDVIYDDTVYLLTIYVTNAEDGSGLELSAVLTPDDAATKDPSAAFTNVYPSVDPDDEPHHPHKPTVTPDPKPDPTPTVTPEPEPDPTPAPTPSTPKTGDDFNWSLYVALFGVSAAVIVLLAATRKRTGKTKE